MADSKTCTPAFKPLLTTTDWNGEWIELQKTRRHADNAEFWNERAKTFPKANHPSGYVDDFLLYAGIPAGSTVLDMGCGTGALSIPLAQKGCHVIAADFSQGMLDVLKQSCREPVAGSIETKLMSWDDDWSSKGLGSNSVDFALASRSIATDNLGNALGKLTEVASRKACITLSTGSSPRADERILTELGLQNLVGRDFLYAFMILADKGFLPEVHYIRSRREETFQSPQEARETLERMVEHSARHLVGDERLDKALEQLDQWVKENLVENPDQGQPDDHGGAQKAFKLKEPRIATWGFISWNCNPGYSYALEK